MAPSTAQAIERLERLVAQFNSGSLDLPDGLLDRNAVFRLNGVAYEDTMGRPAGDPLVRLVARGPAAYRFLSRAALRRPRCGGEARDRSNARPMVTASRCPGRQRLPAPSVAGIGG